MRSKKDIEAELGDMEDGLVLFSDSEEICADRPRAVAKIRYLERKTEAQIKTLKWVLGMIKRP